jgi:hypothetical protein
MSQVITLVTSSTSTATNVLSFASVPTTTLQVGSTITGFGITAGSYIAAFTTDSITINNIVTVFSGTTVTITSNAGSVKKVNSDYKIKVPSGGKITLDTGTNVGLVFITGDLNVQGNTTTINTTNMDIEDNIIVLNKGETGSSVTEITSGIEIDRGTNVNGNAQLLWNESILWRDPWTETSRYGLWVFQTKATGQVNGIRTNSIDTDGNDLALISKGYGTITVSGTTNYEEQILDYLNGTMEILAGGDDNIPNIRAVVDKIDYQILNAPSDKIKRDDTQVIVYDNNISRRITYFNTNGIYNTTVNVFHFLTTNRELNVSVGTYITIVGSGIPNLDGTWQVQTADPLSYTFTILVTVAVALSNAVNNTTGVYVNGSKSNAKITIDNTTVGEFYTTHSDIFNIRIQDSTIQSTVSNTDLILASPGSGSIRIQDSMKIMFTGYATSATPAMEIDCVKIYTDPEGAGDTGIYFVNPTLAVNTGDYRRDELISKKKAIAFSILF